MPQPGGQAFAVRPARFSGKWLCQNGPQEKEQQDMIKINRIAITAALVIGATALAAQGSSSNKLRADTDYQSNFKGPDHDPVTRNPRSSNWPGLPERQGGRSYSKLIYTTSGVRERNAESGRR